MNVGPGTVDRLPSRRLGPLLAVVIALATPRARADEPAPNAPAERPEAAPDQVADPALAERSPAEPASPSAGPEPAPGAEGGVDGVTSPHPNAAVAPAQDPEPPPQLVPKFAAGFVMANASIEAIPSAVARNQLDYGMQGLAGIAAAGTPWEKWDYVAYVIASVQQSAVNGVAGAISAEQITLRFSPTKELSLQAGWMRMPFSLGQAAVITTSMFPTRPEPTALFQTGADAGLLVSYATTSGVVGVRAGLFDGLSLGFTLPQHTTRGPVTALAVEVAPLGGMKPQEADFGDTPFRFAVSGAMLYRDGTAYDPTGFQGLTVQDVRFAGAVRAGYKGFFAQAEYLQAVLSDDLSSRPRVMRGAYGETSYYSAIQKKVGISPLVRVGWSEQDANFFPLHVVSLQTGIAFYPKADSSDPSVLRFVLNYRSERRVEEFETAHGVILSGMYRF